MKLSFHKIMVLAAFFTPVYCVFGEAAQVNSQKVVENTASVQVEKKAVESKIAFVDPQVVVSSSLKWKDLAEKEEKEMQAKVLDLQNQQKEFNKNRAQADRNSMKDLAKKQKDLEIESQSLEIEFRQRQQDLQMIMMEEVNKAIDTVAVDQGWDAVIPKFFFISKRVDITADVVDYMNKQYKKEQAALKFKKSSESKVTGSAASSAKK